MIRVNVAKLYFRINLIQFLLKRSQNMSWDTYRMGYGLNDRAITVRCLADEK